MSNWKLQWLTFKGHSISQKDVKVYLRTCYNGMVETFCEDVRLISKVDIEWYNCQVLHCFNTVLISYLNEADDGKENPNGSCAVILKKLDEIDLATDKVGNCVYGADLQEEIRRIAFCLCIIWLVKEVQLCFISEICRMLHTKSSNFLVNEDGLFFVRMLPMLILDSEYCNSLEHSKDLLKNLVSCKVPGAFLYWFAVILYSREEYDLTLEVCLNHANHQRYESLLFNLTACCYMHLKKPCTAIMHWRKAFAVQNKEEFMAALLFNLHQAYKECKLSEPRNEILTLLSQCVWCDRPITNNTFPVLLFKVNKDFQASCLVSNQRTNFEFSAMAYFIANCYSRGALADEAVQWYVTLSNCLKKPFSPIPYNVAYFELPVRVPNQMQINAELAFSLYCAGKYNDVLAVETSDLLYCSRCFKQAQSNLLQNFDPDKKASLDEVETYNNAAVQLYHCVSIILLKISVLISMNLPAAKQETETALQAMEIVLPFSKLMNAEKISDNELQAKTIQIKTLYNTLSQRLSSAKAYLHYNRALIISTSFQDRHNDVIQSLQVVLQYESKSIRIRWNVVTLLWKIGQHEESIKTWCKTRNINYKLNPKQIQKIREEKDMALNICNSASKKDLLTKDVSILNELLSIIS